MNLTQTVSDVLNRKVTDEEAKEFASNQFGALMSGIRYKDVKNKGVHRIQIVELSTEIAHQFVLEHFEHVPSEVYRETEDTVIYTIKAQKVFDRYYDNIYSIIQDRTI